MTLAEIKDSEVQVFVKDWFHEKKMNEMKINCQETYVSAIVATSDKAVKVVIHDGCTSMCYWCPLSCLEFGKCYSMWNTRICIGDYCKAYEYAHDNGTINF